MSLLQALLLSVPARMPAWLLPSSLLLLVAVAHARTSFLDPDPEYQH